MSIYPFLSVGIVALSFLVYQAQRGEIQYDDEWSKHMCEPSYIVKSFIPAMHPEGITGPGVVNKCIQKMNENMFNKLIAPFMMMLDSINNVINGLKKQMSAVMNVVISLQKVVFATFDKIFRKIYESYKFMAWLVKRIMKIFIKIFKLWISIFKIFLGLYYIIRSIEKLLMGVIDGILKVIKAIAGLVGFAGDIAGSAADMASSAVSGAADAAGATGKVMGDAAGATGKVASAGAKETGKAASKGAKETGKAATKSGKAVGKAFCFDGNVKVLMSNNEYKPIQEIIIGDKLIYNNSVKSIYKFDAQKANMYILNDEIVDGYHTVLYGSNYIFVNEHPGAIKIDYDKKYIYCIDTTLHRIVTKNNIYFDYLGIGPKHRVYINDYIETLNEKGFENDIDYFNTVGYNDLEKMMMLHNNTLIRMENGETKRLLDISIGERVEEGGSVYGKVISNNCTSMMKHNNDIVGTKHIIINDRPNVCWEDDDTCIKDTILMNIGSYLFTENNKLVSDSGCIIENPMLDYDNDERDIEFERNIQSIYTDKLGGLTVKRH